MSEAPALEASGLWAHYGGNGAASAVLADIALQVPIGERLLLLGPNGAGKSTLLRIFSGLMSPTRGSATILGLPAKEARHLVGVLGHSTLLYEELTARENLVLYGELYGVARPPERADELLTAVGLANRAGELVGRLSRGQQQRVALARALVHNPPLLLLDEPETGLDLAAFELLSSVALTEGRTAILTTHNLAGGLRLGTRVAMLDRGRIVHEQASTDPADLEPLSAMLKVRAAA